MPTAAMTTVAMTTVAMTTVAMTTVPEPHPSPTHQQSRQDRAHPHLAAANSKKTAPVEHRAA